MDIEIKDWTEHRPAYLDYKGKWVSNWFSNMEPVMILIGGIAYRSVENYYQAQKVCKEDVYIMAEIALMEPKDAKRFGKTIKLRPDWEKVKYLAMKLGLLHKFNKYPWKQALLNTGDEILIEWNNWGDKYWGVTIKDNLGANMLGKALMEVRADLKIIEADTNKILTEWVHKYPSKTS